MTDRSTTEDFKQYCCVVLTEVCDAIFTGNVHLSGRLEFIIKEQRDQLCVCFEEFIKCTGNNSSIRTKLDKHHVQSGDELDTITAKHSTKQSDNIINTIDINDLKQCCLAVLTEVAHANFNENVHLSGTLEFILGEHKNICVEFDETFPSLEAKCVQTNMIITKDGDSGKQVQSQDRLDKIGFEVEHCNKEYQCKVCDKKCTCDRNITRHVQIRKALKRYHCEICSETFDQRDHLQKHMETHSDHSDYKCKCCNKMFPMKQN